MAVVVIPSLMRDLTGGKAELRLPGATVGELIDALEAAYPGARARLCEGAALSPLLVVAVDGRRSRLGLAEPVGEGSEVRFLPAVSGG